MKGYEVNYLDYQRGTICVERSWMGHPWWLALEEQHQYEEWVGCFSIL